MERIGKQVKLPFSTAFRIAMQGIRIRLGRAVVTITGVVLGVAFLMSVLTGEVIKRTTSHERELRRTVGLMVAMVKSEIGTFQGKTVAIAVLGTPSEAEVNLVRAIADAKPGEIRGFSDGSFNIARHGAHSYDLADLADGASILVLLGDERDCTRYPVSVADLMAKMTQHVVLDSRPTPPEAQAAAKQAAEQNGGGSEVRSLAEQVRRFGGGDTPLPEGSKWQSFFGNQAEQEREREEKERQENSRMIWIMVISLLVTVIGISNALLMSVTERFREIGTMKCLGALSSFIRQLFLIESAVLGLAGSVAGIVLGTLVPLLAYGVNYGFGLVVGSLDYRLTVLMCLGSLVIGTALSIVAAIYPANVASRMVPAAALRTTV